MKSKVRGVFSILLMSLIFYSMVTTKYTHALGDYIVEFVGLNSWTGDYSGFHLTIIYFGIPFIISILVVERYDRPSYRPDGIEEINFYTINGEKANFQLEGNETKIFTLSLNDYKVVGGRGFLNGSESGTVEEIVLTNDAGDKVIMDRNNGFFVELNR